MTQIPPQSLKGLSPETKKTSLINKISAGTKNLISSVLDDSFDVISKGAKKIAKGARNFATGAMVTAQTFVPSATTTGVVGAAGAAMTIESCTKKSDDPITPIKEEPKEPTDVSKLKPYMSVVASDPKLGIMQAYVDPQGTLLPTKVNLKLNTTDGVIESKLRNTINKYFPLAVERHGSGFSTVQEFLDFADNNSSWLVCNGAVGVRSIEKIPGNSGGGGFSVPNFNTLSKGGEFNVLQILESYNSKLISEGKVGFLVETVNPTTNEKILSTKSAARVLLQFYVTEGANGDKMFFNIYFNPNSIQLEFVDDSELVNIPISTQTGL